MSLLASTFKSVAQVSPLLVLLGASSTPSDMPVPVKLQGAIIGKVLDYVKTLPAGERKILVVYARETAGLEDELVNAFREAGLSASAVELRELSGRMGAASAVYIAPGVPSPRVKQLCADNGVLSVSGLPSLAEEGEVSIGVGSKGGRPQIIVNMAQVRAQGHQMSSELLKLATVIQ